MLSFDRVGKFYCFIVIYIYIYIILVSVNFVVGSLIFFLLGMCSL